MKQRVAAIPIAGLIALAAWWGYVLVDRSGDPGRYYHHRHSWQHFVYPTTAVLGWSAAIVAEAAVACVVIARASRTPGACIAIALCFGTAFLAMLPLAMHAPPYYAAHLIWLLLAAGWLVVAAVAAAITSAVIASRDSLPARQPSVREHRVEGLDERD